MYVKSGENRHLCNPSICVKQSDDWNHEDRFQIPNIKKFSITEEEAEKVSKWNGDVFTEMKMTSESIFRLFKTVKFCKIKMFLVQ